MNERNYISILSILITIYVSSNALEIQPAYKYTYMNLFNTPDGSITTYSLDRNLGIRAKLNDQEVNMFISLSSPFSFISSECPLFQTYDKTDLNLYPIEDQSLEFSFYTISTFQNLSDSILSVENFWKTDNIYYSSNCTYHIFSRDLTFKQNDNLVGVIGLGLGESNPSSIFPSVNNFMITYDPFNMSFQLNAGLQNAHEGNKATYTMKSNNNWGAQINSIEIDKNVLNCDELIFDMNIIGIGLPKSLFLNLTAIIKEFGCTLEFYGHSYLSMISCSEDPRVILPNLTIHTETGYFKISNHEYIYPLGNEYLFLMGPISSNVGEKNTLYVSQKFISTIIIGIFFMMEHPILFDFSGPPQIIIYNVDSHSIRISGSNFHWVYITFGCLTAIVLMIYFSSKWLKGESNILQKLNDRNNESPQKKLFRNKGKDIEYSIELNYSV